MINNDTPAPATDYGEPWRYCINDECSIVNAKDEIIVHKTENSMEDRDIHRSIACVNSCAGLPDPELAIQTARSELQHLIRLIEPALESGVSIPGLATMNGAKKAINLLTSTK